MITETLSPTETEARTHLRKVWVPSKIVLEAIFDWLARAQTIDHADEGLRALRWCKWQRIKCLHDPSAQSVFDDQYRRCYRSLRIRSLVDDAVPKSLFDISEKDLTALPRDVEAMEDYLETYVPVEEGSEDVRNGGASYCERHLWGPFSDDTAGVQIHFWPVQDCFKPVATK